MKRVEAIINPFKLDDVKSALSELGVTGLTATVRIRTGERGEETL